MTLPFQLLRALALAVLLLTAGRAAIAAPEQASFDYDIELDVPAAQRKLLEDNLDLYRWRGSERMSEAQLQRLVGLAPEQVREFLATEGFYSPKVEARIASGAGRTTVRLEVVPGEPVRVAGVDLRITGPLADGSDASGKRLEKIRGDWSLRPAAVFRQADWEAAKRQALSALLLDRYPAATLADSRATVNPDTGSVDLLVILDSGPAFTFGPLDIHGLQRYPASLVQRMNPIAAGEPYAQGKLLDLQARLQDSPYFSSANVSVDSRPEQPLAMPVRVEVTENPSRRVGFGIGVSTDTGVRGQVDYRDLDFADRAWRLGGSAKLEQKRQSLGGDLQFPQTELGYRDNLTALLERTDIEDVITAKVILGAKRSRTRGNTETSFGLRYLSEQQEVDATTTTRSHTLSPSYAWTRRDVNHLLYPTRGYLLSLETDAAARTLLSDRSFLRGRARAVAFYPVGKRDQIILRSELGVVAAGGRSGIPSDFLFRTGGDQTVRGYAYQSLGVADGGAIVGGRYLAVASGEYVHWLTPKWGVAVFRDWGNAADSWRDLAFVSGYGIGARWKSPVGPLNLDIAYGREERETRLHFSVGFAF
ncbi:MAG: autotransporter assembly complex protein TamA [Gammaproteobacteria bacterium]|nr:autotransporter assembly complex protein TamA [Gammaproteobacteria bacterium]MBU1646644.1 autotransporter assembly complex protein TamA [Gammaproteobacteria bacterium]MBU1972901.1 autotransporter assembly complex protein TamA [Gammaproteobacteria bacterium]